MDGVVVSAEARAVHAAKLGMWIFLSSELLLFAALFSLYTGYRAQMPVEFATGVGETSLVLGTANTGVLMTSSLLLVLGVHARRHDDAPRAARWVWGTIALGSVFLVLKAIEYREHLGAGLAPGGRVFWTLYYAMTGLHALHVVGGLVALAIMAFLLPRGRIPTHVLENGANWWHLVDLIWLFLWPLFYLLRET